jgi:MFS family permease
VPRVRRSSLLVLFLTVFIDLIGFGMVIPFLSFYAREYGASGTMVGAVVGIYSIMQFFFAPIWGRMSDRVGRRPVILISLVASGSGYFLFAFAHSFAILFISRVIAGVGGANIGTAQAYIADSTTHENRAKGMGLIGAAFGMGFILGPPLSGILSTVGIHHHLAGNLLPGLVAGSMSAIAFCIALFVLGESKPPDATVRTGIPPQFDKRVWGEMTHHEILLSIFLTLFLTLLAVAGMETSVTLHARDRFHFTQMQLAWFFLFMGVIVATIQGGLIGRLAKALGEKTLVIIGAASFTIGLALVPTVWHVPYLYVVAFFVAIGQGLTYPSLTSLVTKASPPNEHGSMLGLASGIGSLARFIGPILSGAFYDLAQARGAFYGQAAIVFCALCVALWMRRLPLLTDANAAAAVTGATFE